MFCTIGTYDYTDVLGIYVPEVIPQLSMILARYEVVDGSMEQNLHYCSNDIMAFKEMNHYDCSFSIGEVEYNIREKYVFGNKGETIEYWSYKSEGPIIYEAEELSNDPEFVSYIDLPSLPVRIIDNKYIWFKDSMAIDYVLEDEKLIFMEVDGTSNEPSRRVIYEFE